MLQSPLLSALIFILILPIIWFGLIPLYGDASELRQKIAGLKEGIAAETELNATIDKLEAEISRRADTITKLEQSITPDKDPASFIAAAEEAASVNGLVLEDVTFEPASRSTPTLAEEEETSQTSARSLGKMPVSITLVGNYPAIRAFVGDLEASLPLMDVTSIEFDEEATPGSENEIMSGVFKVKIALNTYYLISE